MLRSLHRLAVMTALCVASLLVSAPAQACSENIQGMSPSEMNKRFKIEQDGSFVAFGYLTGRRKPEADGTYRVKTFSGRAVTDLKFGRIAQVIFEDSGDCFGREVLLFADCNAPDGIVLDGIDPKPPLFNLGTSTRSLQPPYGPIAFTKDATVEKIAAIAAKHDITFTRDLQSLNKKIIKRMRFNPYQGCKIFYPDSPGARR